MPEVTQPFERVSADLVEMVTSARGHRYVLVVIDHFTRYLQLVPLINKDAGSVADAFIEHFFTLFGPPRTLLTDNGSEFTNRLFRQVCQILEIKTLYTTCYHPQANGMVERVNRVLKDSLATLVGQHPQDWDRMLPYVRLALNTSVHRSVNQTPLYLLTGRDGYFPANLTNYQEADEDAARMLREGLGEARDAAIQSMRNAKERWTRDYDKKIRSRFRPQVGELVLVRIIRPIRPRRVAALAPRWSGPVRVIKQIGPVNYVVQDPYTPHQELKCHLNQLRRYVPREESSDAEPQQRTEEEEDDPDQPTDDGNDRLQFEDGEDLEDPEVPGPSSRCDRRDEEEEV